MVTQYQLENGLKVILVESHKSPVVSLQAWVRTGSADESNSEAGLSHFIEHLLFKGTRKFGVGEIARVIEGSGGELNAYTSFDQTVFYMTLSNRYLMTGLEALSEMVGHPRFDAAEIDAEREVVVEEMLRGQDSLGRVASENLFATAYGKHPYGRPVIGFEKVVRKSSPEKIKRYFDARYGPRNMFLLISGHFERSEAKAGIKKFFGAFEKKAIRKVTRPRLKMTQKKAVIRAREAKFEQSICYLAWPIPAITHKDIPALDLLSAVLGGAESSRLVQKLRFENALVESVGASTFTPQNEGLFLLSFGYRTSNLADIVPHVEESLLQLLRGEISPDEIRRAVTLLSSEEFYSVETVDGLARKFGHLEFHFRNLKVLEKYMQALRKVTIRDLQKAAIRYLSPHALLAASVVKKDAKQAHKVLTEFAARYRKGYTDAIKAKVKPAKIKHSLLPKLKFSSMEPKIDLIQLPSGDRVLFRLSRETPVVSARVGALAGTRLEESGHSGQSELTSRTWLTGTANRTEQQISTQLEEIAAGISPMSGRNSLALSLDVLASFEKVGRDIFFDVLNNPQFSSAPVEREQTILLRQIQAKKDNPAQIAMELFSRNLFGSHPYGREVWGSAAEVEGLDANTTAQWWSKYFKNGRKHFVITGAADRDAWLSAITEFSEKVRSQSHESEKFGLEYPKREVRAFERADKEQSHLVVGYPGLAMKDDRRYTLQIIQSVLAGQGGRLFLELRDKQSLAYSVSPLRMEGIEGGYFGAYIGCAPDKVERAHQMLIEEFQKLTTDLVGDEELERAKRYLVGRQDIDLQKSSAISADILYNDLYGNDFSEAFKVSEKLQAVSSQDIKTLAGALFRHQPVISLVGPRDLKVS